MPPNGQTYTEVRDELAARLGGGMVTIELDAQHWKPAIRQAVRLLNRFVPNHSRAALAATAATKKYLIAHDGLRGIVEMQFVRASLTSTLDPFDPFSYQPTQVLAGLNGDTFADWGLQLMHNEQAQKIASAEPDWMAQWEGVNYYAYVTIPSAYLCAYIYTWGHTADDVAETGMATIDDGMMDWVVDFAEAKAKQTLGRIRSKFPITTPDGTIEVDGRELAEQGHTDEERLMDVIKRRRRPLPPSIE